MAPAADEAGGCVQEAVAQCLRLGFRELAVRSDELQPGQMLDSAREGCSPGRRRDCLLWVARRR